MQPGDYILTIPSLLHRRLYLCSQFTLGAPQPSAMGPRLQALRATHNVQTPALPFAIVQALTSARDLPAPSAAGNTPSTAGDTAPAPDEIGSQAGQSPRESTHAEDETPAAGVTPSAASDIALRAAQSPAADDNGSVLVGTKRKRSIITSDEESDENAPVTRFGTVASDIKEEQNDPAAQF